MKLIIAIINEDDSKKVSKALVAGGYYSTKLASQGSFLKKGNVTYLIGTADEKVQGALDIIKDNSHQRETRIALPQVDEFAPLMEEKIIIGGATVFVLDIEQFEKF